ncbi:cation efflux system protein czcD [Massarina eburnea CBS 473.64]|uniref:Cation efflux system protein czcD n=1 Tax=Massarina eburnea CBS 473.64 TaxID=1395130 RepID=A0A6A6SEF3_9PLEO|nr:cation efflux system protein czcD [Massarina eburnea CBS 473.64]
MAHNHSHDHSHDHGHENEHSDEQKGSRFQVSRKTRLRAVIAISFLFFLAEIITGFYTKSLALVADAFHYLNDLIGFIVALIAVHKQESKTSPADLSYGWSRASLLGAFFNGAFLVALGLSIFLQSIERFIDLKHVQNPKIVLIIGAVGLTLNIISALFLHEHDHGGHGHSHGHSHDHGAHSHEEADTHTEPSITASTPMHASHNHVTTKAKPAGMDLGIMGVLIHVMGDALNNIGVIISALIIWLTHSPARFYADPAVSLWIALMIFFSAIPLTKNAGKILLQSAPPGVNLDDIQHDLESIPGVKGVHELHVWQLDQRKVIASAHVVVAEDQLASFLEKRQTISECLHAYGIHSATLQPELSLGSRPSVETEVDEENKSVTVVGDTSPTLKCALTCGTLCEPLMCCN